MRGKMREKSETQRLPIRVLIGRKTMENLPISEFHSTELAGIFNGFNEGRKTAKPLCAGSIPARASKLPSIKSTKSAA